MQNPNRSTSKLFHAIRIGLLSSTLTLAATPMLAHAQSSFDSQDPAIAIRAVQATLPSVAILGQKDGPAGSTEVFIQVPGVLNMQSVYVLQDGKTVISGVIVPPIKNGFPGGQLELPSGQASVDPRAPRKNVEQVNQVLGVAPASEPIATPRNETFSVPELPREEPVQQTETVQEVPAPALTANERADAAERAQRTSTANASAPASPQPKAADSNNDRVIESLGDLAETGSFSDAVRTKLANDPDITFLRGLAGQDDQPTEYLNLVKTLPAVTQGDAEKSIYVMFDPNCPVCHRYYAELQPMVNSGVLEVHWIPAIVFSDDRSSLTASAALLAELQREGGNPGDMLKAMMTERDFTAKIDSAPNVDRLVPYLDPVVKNTALMAMVRATTPLVVFENTQGELAVNAGIPDPGYESLIRSDNG